MPSNVVLSGSLSRTPIAHTSLFQHTSCRSCPAVCVAKTDAGQVVRGYVTVDIIAPVELDEVRRAACQPS